MSLARELVRTIYRLDGSDDALAMSTRLHIADTVAISVAARREDRMLAALLETFGKTPGPAGLLGGGEAVSTQAAAFMNSALAHVLDYDDIHDLARLHPTTVTFPAALAAASVAESGAVRDAGARIVKATALGNEVMCRLGLACSPGGSGPGADWFLTQLLGSMGAAVAASHVLGLDEDGQVSAMGFAYMQTAGGKEPAFGTGATARSIYPAFAAMGGVTAALLTRAGLTGPSGSLDGSAGLLRIYLGLDSSKELQALVLDGARWHAMDVSFKPWPCCRLLHPYISAALALREQLDWREIERLVIGVNPSAERMCVPLAQRVRPMTLQDAKYSAPFITAFALVRGSVSLTNLNQSALDDEAVLALARRVEIRTGLPDRPGHPPARLEAWTGAQEPVRSASDSAPELDSAAVRRKFLECMEYAENQNGGDLWRAIVECPFDPRAVLELSRGTSAAADAS